MRRRVSLISFPLAYVWFVAGLTMAPAAEAEVKEWTTHRWSGGGGVGFFGSTPDGAECALNGHADYFVTEHLSLGPLAQYAGLGNDVLFGLSAQGRYWWDIPGTERLAKLVFQGGLGFVRAGIKDSDSGSSNTYGSFLIPIGVGIDYALTERMAITADVLLNLTALGETVRTGGREVDLHTNVMPAFYLGVRF
jgi:hypothetical protein